MQTAEVGFSRRDGVVRMTLSVGGDVLADSASPESIARELQIRGLRTLTIDGLFTTELPTREKTLALAMEVAFPEQMPALKLIAACAAWGEEVSFPFPERRQRPRTPAAEQ
jgi:serine kinase of HPr protein (carbohydrate metabolism regulator)